MSGKREYALITAAYWVFTLTDGALRMLVLLFLHGQGYSPLAIASLFLFYEFFGVLTNWLAGWIGARFGLKSTLFSGLSLQIAACSLLAYEAQSLSLGIALVAQGLSGIAKDLTKMSAKSYVKFVVPQGDEGGLMRWVALLTGSKNTLKGVGFFMGGLLLETLGFAQANLVMAAALSLALLASMLGLAPAAGKARRKVGLFSVFSKDERINRLAAARLFLFGSRDAWFVLALPLFLSMELGWGQSQVGAFLAAWVIFYGFIQASAPAWVGVSKRQHGQSPAPDARRLTRWTLLLLLPLSALLAALYADWPTAESLVVGLAFFAAAFASCSAIHSYLIVSYADGEEVALRVGFYYMANAAGRLIGTVLSGALYQAAGQGRTGLAACLATALLFVAAAAGLTRWLESARPAHAARA